VFAILLIAVAIAGIFAFEVTRRWMRETAWRRRWTRRDENDD
jgi:hypothetical protein